MNASWLRSVFSSVDLLVWGIPIIPEEKESNYQRNFPVTRETCALDRNTPERLIPPSRHFHLQAGNRLEGCGRLLSVLMYLIFYDGFSEHNGIDIKTLIACFLEKKLNDF